MGTFDERHWVYYYVEVNEFQSISSDSFDQEWYGRWSPNIFGTSNNNLQYWNNGSYTSLYGSDRVITYSSVGVRIFLQPTYTSGVSALSNLELTVTDGTRTSVSGYTFGQSFLGDESIVMPTGRPIPPKTALHDSTILYNEIHSGSEIYFGRAYLPAGKTATTDLNSASLEVFLNATFWFYDDGGSYFRIHDPTDMGLMREDGRIYAAEFYFFAPGEIPPLRLIQRDDNRGKRPTPRLIQVNNRNGSASAQANDLRITSNNRYDTGF